MNAEFIELITKRLGPLILGQCTEQNVLGTMNSLLYNPIPFETWNIVYDILLKKRNFVEHENGKRFLRWKPTNIEEYHYRISQCTYYAWIIDEKNISHYRDKEIDDYFYE
jgi:hypothetical protein